jgi:hypothetical protein
VMIRLSDSGGLQPGQNRHGAAYSVVLQHVCLGIATCLTVMCNTSVSALAARLGSAAGATSEKTTLIGKGATCCLPKACSMIDSLAHTVACDTVLCLCSAGTAEPNPSPRGVGARRGGEADRVRRRHAAGRAALGHAERRHRAARVAGVGRHGARSATACVCMQTLVRSGSAPSYIYPGERCVASRTVPPHTRQAHLRNCKHGKGVVACPRASLTRSPPAPQASSGAATPPDVNPEDLPAIADPFLRTLLTGTSTKKPDTSASASSKLIDEAAKEDGHLREDFSAVEASLQAKSDATGRQFRHLLVGIQARSAAHCEAGLRISDVHRVR